MFQTPSKNKQIKKKKLKVFLSSAVSFYAGQPLMISAQKQLEGERHEGRRRTGRMGRRDKSHDK
jgi:hypothetical protein